MNLNIKKMKTLHLPIKKKWFDMIFLGTKTEEYREVSKHWITRLLKEDIAKRIGCLCFGISQRLYKEFDQVKFVNGYAKDSDWFIIELKRISFGEGKEEWGAEKGITYFKIELGKILDHNIKK